MNTFRIEPAVVTGLLAALLGVLVSFGVPLTPDQREALLKFFAIAVPLVMAAVIRPASTPNKTIEDAGHDPKALKTAAEMNRQVAKDGGQDVFPEGTYRP